MNKRIIIRKIILLPFLLIITLGVLFFLNKRIVINYIPTEYEKELIDYFKEIALQSEYDDNPQKVIKWKEPMLLYVIKEKEFKPQMSAIKKTIDSINQLATDGFRIVLTEKLSNSNAILYLCNKQKVARLNQYFYELLTKDIDYEISGLAYSEFTTETSIIDKVLIFINSEDSFNIQESTILEEITQSLGLAFDSNRYPNSIFYKDKHEKEIRIKEYSKLDRDIVRLLYHPKMKPGLDSVQVEKIIKKILKSEKD